MFVCLFLCVFLTWVCCVSPFECLCLYSYWYEFSLYYLIITLMFIFGCKFASGFFCGLWVWWTWFCGLVLISLDLFLVVVVFCSLVGRMFMLVVWVVRLDVSPDLLFSFVGLFWTRVVWF